MVYLLLYDLPPDYHYRVVFLQRKLEEVLASQKIMLQRQGKEAGADDDAMMRHLPQRACQGPGVAPRPAELQRTLRRLQPTRRPAAGPCRGDQRVPRGRAERRGHGRRRRSGAVSQSAVECIVLQRQAPSWHEITAQGQAASNLLVRAVIAGGWRLPYNARNPIAAVGAVFPGDEAQQMTRRGKKRRSPQPCDLERSRAGGFRSGRPPGFALRTSSRDACFRTQARCLRRSAVCGVAAAGGDRRLWPNGRPRLRQLRRR